MIKNFEDLPPPKEAPPESWTLIHTEAVPTKMVAGLPDIGVALAYIKVYVSTMYGKGSNEEHPGGPDYGIYGLYLQLEDPQTNRGIPKRTVKLLGMAFLAVLEKLEKIDLEQLYIALFKSSLDTSRGFFLVDCTDPPSLAWTIYDKIREILKDLLDLLKSCRCELEGCRECLGDGAVFAIPKDKEECVKVLEKFLKTRPSWSLPTEPDW